MLENNNKYTNYIGFISAFVLMFIFLLSQHVQIDKVGGDALESWKVGISFFTGAPYHAYVEYRGWLWGAILGALANVALIFRLSPYIGWDVFSAIQFAYIAIIGMPFISGKILNRQLGIGLRLIFALSLFCFFRGHFLYPLVDVSALFFLILSLHVLLQWQSLLSVFFCGIFLGCAVLLRQNYLISLPFIIYMCVVKHRAGYITSLFILFIPILLMQFSNSYYLKKNGKAIGFSGTYVMLAQLTIGLHQQKFESMYIYVDPVGQAILKKEQIANNSTKVYDGGYNWLTLPQYAKLYIKYPFSMVGIYVRHLFNGLDISYDDPYGRSTPFYPGFSNFFCGMNYLVIILGILGIAFNYNQLCKGFSLVLMGAIVLPAVTTIPFRVEPRYLMGAMWTLYAIGIFNLSRPFFIYLLKLSSMRKMLLFILIVGFILACFATRTYIILPNGCD